MEEIELSSSIEKVAKYLPPPFVGLDYIVRNKETGEIGFRWTKDGRVSYTWEWANEKAAAKELARL